jgi:hypothetical protein
MKEYSKKASNYIKKYVEEERAKRKKRKKRKEEKEKEKRIESLIKRFTSWVENYQGKVLSSKRNSELSEFKEDFFFYGLAWTYVHVINKREFKISFESSDEEEIQENLEKTLKELNIEDDGESELLSNNLTTIKVEVFEDGFEISGSTEDSIGAMKANRLGICWLS